MSRRKTILAIAASVVALLLATSGQATLVGELEQISPAPTVYIQGTTDVDPTPPGIDFTTFQDIVLTARGETTATVQYVPGEGCVAGDYTSFVGGNIALIDRGTCQFDAKINNAAGAGATGVLIANTSPSAAGLFEGGITVETTIPALMLRYDLGQEFISSLQGGGTLDMYLSVSNPPAREITILNSPLPQGDTGVWGVREVINYVDAGGAAVTINTVDDAVAAISWDSNATVDTNRVDYQATTINIFDSGTDGHFGNNDEFGVVTAGKATAGGVENASLVATGKIRIPTTGIYTFGVSSDDGFELSVDGERIAGFAADRGTGDTLGAAELTAGVHDIRLVYFERGGGASVEVFAAEGRKSGFDSDFRLIGYQRVEEPIEITVAGLQGQATVTATQPGGAALNSLADAEAALVAGESAGTNVTGTYDSVNFIDPENGASHYFGNDDPFPSDTAADDEDFAVAVEAVLEIPADGTYQLGYRGDDGSSLEIVDQAFHTIVVDATGAAAINPTTGALETNVNTGNSDTQALIDLVAGTYELKATFWERGGGSSFEIFGVDPDDPIQTLYLLVNGGAGTETIIDLDGLQLVGECGELGDMNGDGAVNGLDVDFFVDVLLNGPYQCEGDMNVDTFVNGLDVDLFVAAVVGGGAAAVPEPSTLLLVLAALGILSVARRVS